MSFDIRPMTLQDVDLVYELEKEIFKDSWSYQMIRDEANGSYFKKPFVLVNKKDIIGYAFTWIIEDEIHLNNFAIHPDFRRKGLGLKLINFIFEAFQNYRLIFLEVRASNHVAKHLYQKVGFEEFFRRGKYYPNGEDAIVMLKELK